MFSSSPRRQSSDQPTSRNSEQQLVLSTTTSSLQSSLPPNNTCATTTAPAPQPATSLPTLSPSAMSAALASSMNQAPLGHHQGPSSSILNSLQPREMDAQSSAIASALLSGRTPQGGVTDLQALLASLAAGNNQTGGASPLLLPAPAQPQLALRQQAVPAVALGGATAAPSNNVVDMALALFRSQQQQTQEPARTLSAAGTLSGPSSAATSSSLSQEAQAAIAMLQANKQQQPPLAAANPSSSVLAALTTPTRGAASAANINDILALVNAAQGTPSSSVLQRLQQQQTRNRQDQDIQAALRLLQQTATAPSAAAPSTLPGLASLAAAGNGSSTTPFTSEANTVNELLRQLISSSNGSSSSVRAPTSFHASSPALNVPQGQAVEQLLLGQSLLKNQQEQQARASTGADASATLLSLIQQSRTESSLGQTPPSLAIAGNHDAQLQQLLLQQLLAQQSKGDAATSSAPATGAMTQPVVPVAAVAAGPPSAAAATYPPAPTALTQQLSSSSSPALTAAQREQQQALALALVASSSGNAASQQQVADALPGLLAQCLTAAAATPSSSAAAAAAAPGSTERVTTAAEATAALAAAVAAVASSSSPASGNNAPPTAATGGSPAGRKRKVESLSRGAAVSTSDTVTTNPAAAAAPLHSTFQPLSRGQQESPAVATSSARLGPTTVSEAAAAAATAASPISAVMPTIAARKRRKYSHESFPEKLHRMLCEVHQQGHSHVVSFTENGMGFQIHDPDLFERAVIPRYFRHKHLSSFRRQLNMYGFSRVTGAATTTSLSNHEAALSSPSANTAGTACFRHPMFQRNRPELCQHMKRVSELIVVDPTTAATSTTGSIGSAEPGSPVSARARASDSHAV